MIFYTDISRFCPANEKHRRVGIGTKNPKKPVFMRLFGVLKICLGLNVVLLFIFDVFKSFQCFFVELRSQHFLLVWIKM